MSTAPSTLGALVPKAINWSIALSVLLIIAGLIALCLPFLSGVAITLFFGWMMIISGITHLIFAFKTHTTGGRFWEILIGLIYLFTGIYLILHPLDALLALTLILAIMIWRAWPASSVWVIGTLVGISMIFSGVSRLMLSLAAKRVLNFGASPPTS